MAAECIAPTESDSDAGRQAEPADMDAQAELGLVDFAARVAMETSPLAAVAGVYATPPSDQDGLKISTDLGWTFVHRDRIWTLFGDSWLSGLQYEAFSANDAIGHMSVAEFPGGESVEAFVAAHPAPMGEPAWHAAAPPLHFLVEEGGMRPFAPMVIERDGIELSAGNGYAPMTGFSNGRDDERAGAFAISQNYDLVECDEGSCSDGYVCDSGLGRDRADAYNRACVVADRGSCVAGPGLCLDPNTSRYDETGMGRTESAVVRLAVGVMDEAEPSHFRAQSWPTRKFYNLTSRSVTDFDPSRARGADNDYRPARGNALPRSGLLIWGRPQFGGIGAEGRDAQLYLAWVALPEPDGEGHFDWRPRYFAGVEPDGRPRFADSDSEAKALDLDAASDGDQPRETQDVVGQMAITWLPGLQRFVMFYGGSMGPEFLDAVFNFDRDKVEHNPDGSLFVRFAQQPWGPWTAPRVLLAAGDVSDQAPAEGLYAPGGILAHNNCEGSTCARHDPVFRLIGGNNNGTLYGPNIVDAWTVEKPDTVDLYWFVSTWNPYQVVMMKTTLTTP